MVHKHILGVALVVGACALMAGGATSAATTLRVGTRGFIAMNPVDLVIGAGLSILLQGLFNRVAINNRIAPTPPGPSQPLLASPFANLPRYENYVNPPRPLPTSHFPGIVRPRGGDEGMHPPRLPGPLGPPRRN